MMKHKCLHLASCPKTKQEKTKELSQTGEQEHQVTDYCVCTELWFCVLIVYSYSK